MKLIKFTDGSEFVMAEDASISIQDGWLLLEWAHTELGHAQEVRWWPAHRIEEVTT